MSYVDAENAAMKWDLSAKKDESIVAWVNANGDYYDLYIGSNKRITPTGVTANSMFNSLTSLETIKFNGLLDLSQATSIRSMFSGCSSLKSVDLETMDTSNIKNMGYLFYNCSSLEQINLNNFKTGNVSGMGHMFRGCSSLTSLDLRSFDTANVTDMVLCFILQIV